MKRTQLLNRHLSQLVAELGHLDEITIADAGLPVPNGVPVIDLAVSPSNPRIDIVLRALAEELILEGTIMASEAQGTSAEDILNHAISFFAFSDNSKITSPSFIDHERFKNRTAHSKAVIRTGEVTPYCNIILQSGVAF